MKRFLLASVATVGLTLAALPAAAQVAVPATPPITTPTETEPGEATTEQQVGATASVTAETPGATAQSETSGETQAQTPPPEGEPVVTTARPIAPAQTEAQTAVMPPAASPTVELPAATAIAEPPAATATAEAPAAMPEIQAQENAVLATPASATTVCEQRTTSVHFGARGSALSQQNRNAIQYAADAASVCDLQTVTIVDSAGGRTSSRRAEAVRATLISQGIPAERITVSQEANADAEAASTGRLDVRMAFAGVASGGRPETAAAAPAAAPAIAPAPTPEAPPAVTPQAPDTMTPPPAEGGPAGEEDTDPTPST